jgi:hypothetical protein
LRGAALGGKELPLAVTSCLEHRLDEAKHSAIRHSLGDQREEFLVFHGPEKISEIRIDDPLGPALYLFPHFAQGVLRRPPSSIRSELCLAVVFARDISDYSRLKEA